MGARQQDSSAAAQDGSVTRRARLKHLAQLMYSWIWFFEPHESARISFVGITSGALARDLIDAIVADGLPFAILHRRDDLQQGKVGSDVDLVIAAPTRIFISGMKDPLTRLGLVPILVWTYDSGGSSVFLASATAADGIQLDLLYDPRGLGRYGIRSEELLEERFLVDGWPSLNRRAEIVYLLRKRLVKENKQAALALRRDFLAEGVEEMKAIVERVLTPDAAASVNDYVAGHRQTGRWPRSLLRRTAPELRRIWKRLVNPIGAWIHVAGSHEREVSDVVGRLRRFIPHTGRGTPMGSLWYWRECAPVRWRAGVFVTWGFLDQAKKPDLVITNIESGDDIARSIVNFLAERISIGHGLD